MKTMMKYILSLILFLSASVSQAYVCDRLDIMGSNGLIQSFMVDDINKFTNRVKNFAFALISRFTVRHIKTTIPRGVTL